MSSSVLPSREAGGDAGLSVYAETGLAECFASFAALEGAVVDDRPELLKVRTGLPITFFNGIPRTRLGDDANEQVQAAIAWFAEHRVAFRWWLLPNNTPRNLIELLAANGMRHHYFATAMVADLESAPPPREARGFTWERVDGPRMLATWLDVFCAGFQIPDLGRRVWDRAFTQFGFDANAQWREYLGMLDGVPVATSALCIGPTIAGVYNVVTLPQARGRGVGAAITAVAMDEGRAAGHTKATLQASEMGLSVYRSLGFVECGDLELYDWRPEY